MLWFWIIYLLQKIVCYRYGCLFFEGLLILKLWVRCRTRSGGSLRLWPASFGFLCIVMEPIKVFLFLPRWDNELLLQVFLLVLICQVRCNLCRFLVEIWGMLWWLRYGSWWFWRWDCFHEVPFYILEVACDWVLRHLCRLRIPWVFWAIVSSFLLFLGLRFFRISDKK